MRYQSFQHMSLNEINVLGLCFIQVKNNYKYTSSFSQSQFDEDGDNGNFNTAEPTEYTLDGH